MKPWILGLADDLTGALEAGAKFADRGLSARVTTELTFESRPECDVLVIDTETRHASKDDARKTVHATAAAAARFQPLLVYKKTDSALRGHIAAEFDGLRNAFPGRQLIYAPAHPEMGRTVKHGVLFIEGKVLAETEFAQDMLNPVTESDVRALLNDETVLVLDGETERDIAEAARLIKATEPFPLAAGPSALAGALAATYDRQSPELGSWPSVARCLVVNGSRHAASLQQLATAHAQGCFGDKWICFTDYPEGTGVERARRLGERVRGMLKSAAPESSAFDSLLVFGGDTAFGIHSALGAAVFEPYGEILPGVPISRCGNLIWMTKAGGFGTPNVLSDLQRLLR